MAFLGISNGKSEREVIKVLSGDVWKIDSYTTNLEDSYEVRTKNFHAFQKFQKLYPTAGRGSVRLFLPSRRSGETKEWLVFYRKHKIAFSRILLNLEFMEDYVEEGSKYFTQSDMRVVDKYPASAHEYMNVFCRKLKEKDRIISGCEDGGPLYYGFMRDILYRYLKYSKKNPNVPSIEQLYTEYYREKNNQLSLSSDCDRTTTPSISMVSYKREADPDYLLYDEMDRLETRYNKWLEFLGNPHFDRYYGNIFTDSYLFILGTSAQDLEQKEIYRKWWEYAERGFDGTVVCPAVFKNSGFIDKFEVASIVFFCIFESEPEVEKMISLALMNQAEVVIQLYDISLYPKYAKKYPQATILLAGVEDEDELLDSTDDFMISCYNRENEKRYKK